MPQYGYVVVEGPHDVELVYRLLSPLGLRRIQWMADLDPYFHPLVPTKFPHQNDLQKRVPVPLFLASDTHCVAIHSAIGDTRLVSTIEENAILIDFDELTGIGVILDSDSEVTAQQRYELVKGKLAARGFTLPENPGEITTSQPQMGAFVLPDNQSPGNLEDLFIECAEGCYPGLLASAQLHVEFAKGDDSFTDPKREDLSNQAKFHKAVVGSIASVLRPGRAVQSSIQDNLWLRGESLKLPRVQAVQAFLQQLLKLN